MRLNRRTTGVRHLSLVSGGLLLGISALTVLLFAQARFREWKRLSDAPILSPTGDGWQSAGAFNPAVMVRDGKFVMLYRAQDAAGTSRLGYAESVDGIHFTRRSEPVLVPAADYEKDGGVEDPRLVEIGDTYYLTYTGYNKKDAQLCLARVDQVRRHRFRKDCRKILDVLAWHRRRQNRSDGSVQFDRPSALDRRDRYAGVATAGRQV
jgi:hypothetical protein